MDQLNLMLDEIGLTSEEQRVWEILRHHRGREAAVLGPDLAGRVGLTYTEVRGIISHLVNDHSKLIASGPRGYFVPVTPEEVNDATRSLRHRGIAILVRAARLQRVSVEQVFGQAVLELEAARAAESGERRGAA